MLRFVCIALTSLVAATNASANEHRRFLALGDSYTIGEGVAAADRWPVQLAAALNRAGVAIDTAEILARTGWTTDELASAMHHHRFHPPYALITLLIGVNNQYQELDLQNYRDQFRMLLNRAIELADRKPQHVIVVSIPDWGVTRFGRESARDIAKIAHEIDLYNDANAQIAASLGAHYVDVTALSREGGDHTDTLVGDGLHPSTAMYRRWVEGILPVAEQALSSH